MTLVCQITNVQITLYLHRLNVSSLTGSLSYLLFLFHALKQSEEVQNSHFDLKRLISNIIYSLDQFCNPKINVLPSLVAETFEAC